MQTRTIRRAQPEEFDAVGALTVRAYVEGGHLDGDEDYTEVLRDASARAEKATLLVAVEGDSVVGTATFAMHGSGWAEAARPGEAELRMLAVVPEHHGSGVGRALLEAVVAEARSYELDRIVLFSQESMTQAQAMYRRSGFYRRPEYDWRPLPEVRLLSFALDL
ncbi:GNAT family N-acetyltransferase [Allosaccharopolyspora coralli]|uniref:GNAT family N-acetyltransferase n=1 Tax=Allosaccharopolyspora coralli TaxID=2665642 RepID=A0A5Q3QHX4_9PSEU|nr:GNAT family N-acetyltransferase [Allosaccharopolyspora coralli]QGK71115.1 GNAT family N-acetyltransferase [Allosaccharopolyspora coralli]